VAAREWSERWDLNPTLNSKELADSAALIPSQTSKSGQYFGLKWTQQGVDLKAGVKLVEATTAN
jgi:hypothetical protein